MKILIGTPIHESKDYALERWLENVSRLQYPADLFMVDNSKGTEYVAKVKKYCKKYGVSKYKIEHFEIDEKDFDFNQARSIKVEYSQEIIRRYALELGYDAWFSWECDQLIPPDALNGLLDLMQGGNYMMVVHNSWARTNPTELNTNMGVTLINREGLKRAWFLPEKDGKISLNPFDVYNVDETMFKKRLLAAGGRYIEVFGIVNPICHLNK